MTEDELMTEEEPRPFMLTKTDFDPDHFREMLEAMHGYWRLPTTEEGGFTNLPEMPDIGRDALMYYYGIAMDEVFVEVMEDEHEDELNHYAGITMARLGENGREFLMKTQDAEIWTQVKEIMSRYGVSLGIQATDALAASAAQDALTPEQEPTRAERRRGHRSSWSTN